MNGQQGDDEWERLWDERLAALEAVFGPAEDLVGHAPVPLELGPEAGGAADVVYFKGWRPGRLTVTADLLGIEGPLANEQGAYELAICHRDDERWGPNIISRLANYVFESPLNPGETMDIGSAVPQGSSVAAFLFHDLARFEFRGEPAGVLLCIGITEDELDACRDGRTDQVLEALRANGVFPYTDLRRRSVLGS
ncbi:MAG TPA: suppressor of fused domain protein [Ramlibacter sp.]|nr:suppressor of fused domain protein [Ramlibacter sp.]